MDITHGINGLEALQRIRELPGEAAGVPVIGISPSDSPAANAAFAMNAHLAKPVIRVRLPKLSRGSQPAERNPTTVPTEPMGHQPDDPKLSMSPMILLASRPSKVPVYIAAR